MEIKSALIVDDSQMARVVLKKQLASRGISVNMVDSGEASIDFLEQNESLPDIIFMDCLMPGMDGFEATTQIHSNPKFSNIPIVMCTGKESDEDKQKAFSLGAAGYMCKSSSTEPLETVINDFSQQEAEVTPLEPSINKDDMLKSFQQPISDLATSIAEKVANQVASTQIATFTEECANNSNEQLRALSEQLEEKVIFTVKKSLEGTYSYIDDKVSKIDNNSLRELKVDIEESINNRFNEFKAEQDAVDINALINSTINEIVDTKIHSAIENNLSTYVSVLLEHEVAQSLIESKIQDQLAQHNRKLQILEEIIESKADKNSNLLSIIAILMGATALAISFYPLIKGLL